MSVRSRSGRRLGLVGLAALAVCALIAGCSSDGGSSATQSGRHQQNSQQPNDADGSDSTGQQPSNTDTGETVKSFTISFGAAPISLDVTKDFDGTVMGIMSLFTEPLERLASDGSTSPNLATSVSRPDDTTIVYTLRRGVKFSNGDPMTADDVVWSIEHAANAKGGAQTAGALQSIAGVTASGPNEVTVKLSAPDPNIRTTLALVTLVQDADFAKAHAKELGSPAAVPVGTGPYRVSEDTTDHITLTRNPHYRGNKPAPDKITVVFIADDNSAQLAMRSNDIQGAIVANGTSVTQWKAIDGVEVYAAPMLYTSFYSMDTTVAPFDDIHVRKAIAHAIDRTGLVQAGFGGYADTLKGLLPPGELVPVAPSEDAVSNFLNGLTQYDFDMDKAKQELAQSKHPDGFAVTIPYIDGLSWTKLTALNLQQNLKPLGITVTPKAMTSQEWTAALYAHKNTPFWPMVMAAPSPDPAQLAALASKAAITTPGGFNFARWAPADLQDAVGTLKSSTDRASRWEAAKKILTAMATDVPYIPLYHPQNILVLSDGFHFAQPVGVMEIASGAWANSLTRS